MSAVRSMMVNVGANVGPYVAGMNTAGASTARFRAQTTGATAGASRMGGGLAALTSKLIGPAALVYGVSRAMGAAQNFETSTISLRTQIGLTADQSDELAAASRRVGTSLGVGSQAAIDASWNIASAGLRGKDAIEALEYAAKASAVGFGEMNTIASLTSAAVNAYGSDVLTAAEATDVMANAVRQGTAAPEELASSLGRALPVASAMSVEFHELSAAVAGMTRTGTSASEAVTQIRAMLISILSPTEGAAEAMAGFGLSSEGLQKTIQEDGLLVALQQLSEATGMNSAALADIFPNVRAFQGFLDLMGPNAAENARVFEEMAESLGLVDEALADVNATSTQFQIDRFKSNLSDAALASGGLNEGLRETLRLMNDIIEAAGGNPEAFGSRWDPENPAHLMNPDRFNRANTLEYLMDNQGHSEAAARDFLGMPTRGQESDSARMDAMAAAALGTTGTLAGLNAETARWQALSDRYNADNIVGGFGEVEDAAEDVMSSIERLQGVFDGLIRLHLDGESAAIRFEDKLADLNDTLQAATKIYDDNDKVIGEQAASLDRSTEAGRENEKAVIDVARAILDEAEARHVQGDSLGEIMALYETQVDRLRDVMLQANLTEDEVESYIQMLGLTPEDIFTALNMDSATARRDIEEYIRLTGQVPRWIDTTIRARVDRASLLDARNQVMATGQNQARASGGPFWPGQPFLVGEHGPEIVEFAGTGRVVPANQTQQMLRGGDGASQTTLNVYGNPDPRTMFRARDMWEAV